MFTEVVCMGDLVLSLLSLEDFENLSSPWIFLHQIQIFIKKYYNILAAKHMTNKKTYNGDIYSVHIYCLLVY